MGPGLEPATIRNIYTCLRSIMTGAVRAGLISESPCRLDPGELPPKRDGERYQRSTHVFNAAELATILTSPEIELVDRAFYGLLATCWMRPGEAVELRWADIDWEAMPLPRIAITRARSGKKIFPTKTGVAREAPVCPLLGDMLRELRDGGWARIVGRAPNRDDLVLARLSAAGAPVYLEKKRQHLRWCRAERALGLRHRWVYDLKAAGMSIAQEHGAPQAVVASISHDPKTLGRRWGEGPGLVFVMLNPSTADAERDDATIRKCMSYARRWGYFRIIVVNLFAFRATDPKDLRAAMTLGEDVVGPLNDTVIRGVVAGAEWVICAWGAAPWATDRAEAVADLIFNRKPHVAIHALAYAKNGAPVHPLYQRLDLLPVVYPMPALEAYR